VKAHQSTSAHQSESEKVERGIESFPRGESGEERRTADRRGGKITGGEMRGRGGRKRDEREHERKRRGGKGERNGKQKEGA